MTLSPADWHRRFQQQAAWTAQLRGYLLGRLALRPGARILEVGCGTGAVLADLPGALSPAGAPPPAQPGIDYAQAMHCGIDINLSYLRLAQSAGSRLAAADVLRLPFPPAVFDAVVCHYFLLWVQPPAAALAAMTRVTRPGGAVIAFAEPDYGGRIDHPAPLAELGRRQTAALAAQGADPLMGRQLAGLFHAAGLHSVETGLLGGQWQGAPSPEAQAAEWAVLAADLAGTLPPAQLAELRQRDADAWQRGERVLFVPTFYAIGIR